MATNQYTIQSGETLGGLAQRFGTTIQSLLQLNPNITNPNLIQAGANLNLPGQPAISNLPNINASLLGQSGTVPQLPQVNPVLPAPSVSALSIPQLTSVDPSSPGAVAQTTGQLSQAESFGASLKKRFAELSAKLLGKSAEQQQLEETAGISEQSQNIRDLTTKLMESKARFDKMQVDATGMPIGIERQRGIIAQTQRNEAISLSGQSAIIQTLQGNLEAAKADIDHALKLEFDPIEQEIDMTKEFINMNYQDMDRIEKRQAQALNIQLDRERMQLQDARDYREKVYNLQLQAAKDGVPPSEISKIKTPEDYGFALLHAGGTGLTQEQKEKIASNPSAKQAVSRIGVINAVKSYIQKLDSYKGSGGFDFNRLTRSEKRELQTALETTVGSAINVAQGQGAMGVEEANRILKNLEPTRFTRTSVFDRSAQGVIDAQSSLLLPELDFLESTYPGVKSLKVFNDYLVGDSEDSYLDSALSSDNAYQSYIDYINSLNTQ